MLRILGIGLVSGQLGHGILVLENLSLVGKYGHGVSLWNLSLFSIRSEE